jgi:hypothetical protein
MMREEIEKLRKIAKIRCKTFFYHPFAPYIIFTEYGVYAKWNFNEEQSHSIQFTTEELESDCDLVDQKYNLVKKEIKREKTEKDNQTKKLLNKYESYIKQKK